MTKIKTAAEMTKAELAHYNRPFTYYVVGSKKDAKLRRHKQDTLNADRCHAQDQLRT